MTLRARLFDARGTDRDVELTPREAGRVDDRRLLWIDLDARDEADLRRLGESLALDPRIVQHLRSDGQRPRLMRFADQLVLTIGALDGEGPDLGRRELDLVLGRNIVTTVHDGPLAALAAFDEELHGDTRLGQLDAGAFTAGLVDSVLNGYFREIEAIERDIDALDQVALRARGGDDFLTSVVALRRRIALVRRALSPNREALSPIGRPDFEVHAELGQVWPGTLDRLERAIDAVENTRELLVGTVDIYLGRAAHRSNEVMKVLTIVSSVALPAIVLAGVMGMNFKIPFFDAPDNFFLVVGAMVATSLAIVSFARWRSWL